MKASMIATALMLAATTAVTSAQAPTAGDPHHPPQSATPAPAPAQPPTGQPGMGMMGDMPMMNMMGRMQGMMGDMPMMNMGGGMPPAMFRPSAKPLSGRYLSFAEREEIALLRVQGCSMREVARRLGRTASTISRELRRNAATRSGGLEYLFLHPAPDTDIISAQHF